MKPDIILDRIPGMPYKITAVEFKGKLFARNTGRLYLCTGKKRPTGSLSPVEEVDEQGLKE